MHQLNSFVVRAALVALAVASACSSDTVTDNRTIPGLELALTPSVDTLYLGGPQGAGSTATVTASARAGTGPIDLPGHVFEASDSSIVAITTTTASSATAAVTARALGTTTVAVRVNSVRASATIVVLPYVKSVTAKASATPVLVGDTILVSAAALGWSGDTLSGQAITFSSSSPAAVVTTVPDSGKGVTAKVVFTAPGTATITARNGDATATVALTALAKQFIGGGSTALSSGRDATCGLLPLGRVYCFGKAPIIGVARDTSCFDVDGTKNDPAPCTLVPLPIAGQLQMTAVAVGDSVACGIATGGRVYCWGDQKYGQVGNGISQAGTSALPTRVTGPLADAATFTQIAAGGTHACGLTSTGAALCWGRDTLFQLGGGDALPVNSSTPIPAGGRNSFKAIVAGHAHTCGLRTDGVALCWGDNRRGQLGRGAIGNASDDALPVVGPTFTQISASRDNTCGLTSTGTVYCWGANESGQTGQAAADSTPTPTQISGSGYTFVAVGGSHACALNGTGVSCWGSNQFGQLGRGPGIPLGVFPTPAAIIGGVTFTSLSSGTRTSCAVAANGGGAYCWGSSIYGATGSQIQALTQPTPTLVAPPQ